MYRRGVRRGRRASASPPSWRRRAGRRKSRGENYRTGRGTCRTLPRITRSSPSSPSYLPAPARSPAPSNHIFRPRLPITITVQARLPLRAPRAKRACLCILGSAPHIHKHLAMLNKCVCGDPIYGAFMVLAWPKPGMVKGRGIRLRSLSLKLMMRLMSSGPSRLICLSMRDTWGRTKRFHACLI